MKKSCYGSLLFVLLLACGMVSAATPTQEIITFGVAPQQTPTALATAWTPVMNYLSQKTGYRFAFKTGRNINSYHELTKTGAFDIAYINPWVYAADTSNTYKVFAKEKDMRLKGIIVVGKNSAYNSIESLHNTTMAFPDPGAFAATLLPLAHLKKAGIAVTPKNVMSHNSVYLAVAKGLYPAGGGVIKTLENTDPAVRDQLQILWTSPPYTPHPIAAHARVSPEVVKKLLAAMSAMHLDPQGKALLEGINFKGIVSAEDHEYDAIRALENLPAPIQ